VRSKANPRNLVFTHWIVYLSRRACHGKGTKTTAKPMQNRFSLTPESARHPLGVLLRTFDQRRSLCSGDSDCYRRLGEIPQQVVGRQIIPNTERKQ
jgi:hypothetical protein